MVTPELMNQMSVWRAKALAGTLTQDEMRDAIKVLRENRLSALTASKPASKAKAKSSKGPKKSADDLLSELDDL